jgi:hypothetical protein
MACCGSRPAAAGSSASSATADGKSSSGRPSRKMDSQTEFMMQEHGWAFTRIAQLCVPSVARAHGE